MIIDIQIPRRFTQSLFPIRFDICSNLELKKSFTSSKSTSSRITGTRLNVLYLLSTAKPRVYIRKLASETSFAIICQQSSTKCLRTLKKLNLKGFTSCNSLDGKCFVLNVFLSAGRLYESVLWSSFRKSYSSKAGSSSRSFQRFSYNIVST